jgi:hypothetical protein
MATKKKAPKGGTKKKGKAKSKKGKRKKGIAGSVTGDVP